MSILPDRGPLPSPKRSRFCFAQAGPSPLMFFGPPASRLPHEIMSRPEAGGPEEHEEERTWRSALRQEVA